MALIADILLVAASLGLAVYCVVLSRRLARFTDLEKGVGGAVAVLSAQVDDLTRALKTARETAQDSATALSETTARAEDAARRLELHVAALHDLPAEPPAAAAGRGNDQSAAHADASAKPAPNRNRPEPAAPADEFADDFEGGDAAAHPSDISRDPAPSFAHASRSEPVWPGAATETPTGPAPEEADMPSAPMPSLFAHRRIQPGALG